MALPAAAAPEVFPTPVFEGSEKRIEIDFAHAAGATTAPGGLRSIARQQLDAILDLAACCIVSARHGKDFDAYVLSESSLFVYARKAILKTCGTTKLLAAVPALVDAAAGAGLEPCRAKYSRASYLFPEQQVRPYACCPGLWASFDVGRNRMPWCMHMPAGRRSMYLLACFKFLWRTLSAGLLSGALCSVCSSHAAA